MARRTIRMSVPRVVTRTVCSIRTVAIPSLPTNFVILVCVFITWFIFIYFSLGASQPRQEYQLRGQNLTISQDAHVAKKRGTKWIVIAEDGYNYDNIAHLLNATYKDWFVLIVSPAKHNHAHRRIRYLDDLLAADAKLPQAELKSSRSSEERAGTMSDRINRAYLALMRRGAEWIYETSSHYTSFRKGSQQFDFEEELSGVRFQRPDNWNNNSTRLPLFNPYQFFGRPDLRLPWSTSKYAHDDEEFFRLCRWQNRSAVQYAMLESDAHTPSSKASPYTAGFNKFAPAVTLARDTLSPWHRINTLYHSSAFFTLFRPSGGGTRTYHPGHPWRHPDSYSPTSRDDFDASVKQHSLLVRSLVTQKLLHLAGQTVAFVPANMVDTREKGNKKNRNWSPLPILNSTIDFFLNWQCSYRTIPQCITELSEQLVKRKLWTREDAEQLSLWMDALRDVGYQFPEYRPPSLDYPMMDENQRTGNNCRRMKLNLPSDLPSDENIPATARWSKAIRNWKDLMGWCSYGAPRAVVDYDNVPFPKAARIAKKQRKNRALNMHMHNMGLIITNNYPWRYAIGHVQRQYLHLYGVVIFCGTYHKEKLNKKMDSHFLAQIEPFNYVHLNEMEVAEGYTGGYYCLSKVADLRLQNIKGFFIASDDVIINPWFDQFNYDILNAESFNRRRDVIWTLQIYAQEAVNKAHALISEKYAHRKDIREMVKKYQAGLLANDYYNTVEHLYDDTNWQRQLRNRDGYSITDFVYVPSSNVSYAATLFEVFQEAEVFHEIAFNKLEVTLPKVYLPRILCYIWHGNRPLWYRFYDENIGMMHAVKPSWTTNALEKSHYCDHAISRRYQVLFRKTVSYKEGEEPIQRNGLWNTTCG